MCMHACNICLLLFKIPVFTEEEPVSIQEQEPLVVISQPVAQSTGLHTQTTIAVVSTPPHTMTTPTVCSPTHATIMTQSQEVATQSVVVQSTLSESTPVSQTPSTVSVSTKRPRDEGET